jgi:hypothetical protein
MFYGRGSYNIINIYKKNHWKIWKYKRVRLIVGTKNSDRKYLEDQKLLKYFLRTQNEIQNIYRN